MSAARWISGALMAAGAIAGTMLDTQRAPHPARVGDYYVLAADFHVHAFPGDGALPSWELAREASRRGLHAIVISNHNQTMAERFGRRLRHAGLPLIIPAQEVTTPGFHLVAVGISRTVDWRQPELEIVNDVHAQGGVVIAAHPVGRYWRASEAMLERLDGVEVAHPLTESLDTGRDELTAFFTRVRKVNPRVAPIGSSDFHMVAPIGVCRTYVFADSISVAAVLDAIRAGRTVAEDTHGTLYGEAQFIELLRQSSSPERRQAGAWQSSFAAAAALLGLFGLVVLR